MTISIIGLAAVKEDGGFMGILEPIPSAALTISKDYLLASRQHSWGLCLMVRPRKPSGFRSQLQFSEDFGQRAIAAARTYKVHE